MSHQCRLGIGRNRLKFSRKQSGCSVVTVRCGREREILQRAAQTDMLLSQITIKSAWIPSRIRIQLDLIVGDLEKPGLGVVWTGGQNRRAHERQWPILLVLPVLPWLVG